jgi:hypothetical protein
LSGARGTGGYNEVCNQKLLSGPAHYEIRDAVARYAIAATTWIDQRRRIAAARRRR